MADERNTGMEAREIYAASLVWDDHCGFSPGPEDALDPLLSPWRDAGVDYLSINVYFDPQPWTSAEATLERLRARLLSEAPYCRIVSSCFSVRSSRRPRRWPVTRHTWRH